MRISDGSSDVCSSDLAYLVIPIVRNFQQPDPLRTSWLPVTVVVVFLLRGLGSYISESGMGCTGYRVVYDLRRELIDKLMRLPTPYYDTHTAGQIGTASSRERGCPNVWISVNAV